MKLEKIPPQEDLNLIAIKYFFKAYIVDQNIREIVHAKNFHALQTNATLSISQFKDVDKKYRTVIPDYIKVEQYAA